jgi:glutaminase
MGCLHQIETLTTDQLAAWAGRAAQQALKGQVVNRISRLSTANPQWFAIHIDWQTTDLSTRKTYSWGDTACTFPLMSTIKPFLLLYLLEHWGVEAVFQWVGAEPSDAPFNSLEQLLADQGRPRNPMINSGAIALADKLVGQDATERCRHFCQWLNHQAECHLKLDLAMLSSVRVANNEPNQAIASYLAQVGRIADPALTLDTYEQICCLAATVSDLANLGTLLAYDHGPIAPPHRRIVNALMLTCGLYEASGVYAIRIGLPIKSGISGALLAIVPRQGAIACYSPALDRVGNPIVGLAFIETLAQELQLSLFG